MQSDHKPLSAAAANSDGSSLMLDPCRFSSAGLAIDIAQINGKIGALARLTPVIATTGAMTSSKHERSKAEGAFASGPVDDPGIGQSGGLFATGVDPDMLEAVTPLGPEHHRGLNGTFPFRE